MPNIDFYFALMGLTILVGGFGLGVGCERSTRPATRIEQWEQVYNACSHRTDGETFDTNRRDKCIAAADKVMGCLENKQ